MSIALFNYDSNHKQILNKVVKAEDDIFTESSGISDSEIISPDS